VRGPTHGIALAYAWVSYPFTLFALECNSNDALVAVLVLAALLAACYRADAAAGARGALAALAGLTKFAPLALAPLLALHVPRTSRAVVPSARTARSLLRGRALFVVGFALAAAASLTAAFAHDSLTTIFARSVTYQAQRESPFSIWGLYSGLGALQDAVQLGSILLALGLALTRRARDAAGLAAACAAVLIAIQLGITHWFYLYIPWFFGLVMLALLAQLSVPSSSARGGASGFAQSTPRAAVLSSG